MSKWLKPTGVKVWRERRELMMMAILLWLGECWECAVTIISLGYYDTEIRAWLLFKVFKDIDE